MVFRHLVTETTKERVSHLRPIRIPHAFHTDGKLDHGIPILVELGFSAVHGCEKTANELSDLVDRFGNEIVLVQNMDVTSLFLSTPRQIRLDREDAGGGKQKEKVHCCVQYQSVDNSHGELPSLHRNYKEFQPSAGRPLNAPPGPQSFRAASWAARTSGYMVGEAVSRGCVAI